MELFVKCDLGTARFLVDGRPWPHAALDRFGCDWDHETYDRRNAVERDFKEGKRRTYQFENYFCLDSAEPAESWLKTLAFAWNPLI